MSARIPEIILSFLAGPVAMAWYQASNRVGDVAEQAGSVLATGLFPRLAASEEKGEEQVEYTAFGTAAASVAALAATAAIAFDPQSVVVQMFGNEFDNAGLVMLLVGAGIVFRMSNHVIGVWFSAVRAQVIRLLASVVAAVSGIVIAAVAIHFWDAAGAALAVSAIAGVTTLLLGFNLPHEIRRRTAELAGGPLTLAVIASVLAAQLLPISGFFGSVVVGLVAMAVGGGALMTRAPVKRLMLDARE